MTAEPVLVPDPADALRADHAGAHRRLRTALPAKEAAIGRLELAGHDNAAPAVGGVGAFAHGGAAASSAAHLAAGALHHPLEARLQRTPALEVTERQERSKSI